MGVSQIVEAGVNGAEGMYYDMVVDYHRGDTSQAFQGLVEDTGEIIEAGGQAVVDTVVQGGQVV